MTCALLACHHALVAGLDAFLIFFVIHVFPSWQYFAMSGKFGRLN